MNPKDRYQICCSFCGHLSTEAKRHEAIEYARHIASKHQECRSTISVFDCMAHKGKVPIIFEIGWAVKP